MHKLMITSVIAVIGLGLAACSNGQPGDAKTAAASSPLDTAINHALNDAETKLTTQDFTLTERSSTGQLLPDAKITPKGDLIIAGKPVPLMPAQRAEVLAYRQQGIAIGKAGIAIGRSGAELGLKAVGTAIAAVFSGKSNEQIQQDVKAQTTSIHTEVTQLCDRLPALMATQKQLAADLPAFRPYATMTQKDVADCVVNAKRDVAIDHGQPVAPATPGTH